MMFTEKDALKRLFLCTWMCCIPQRARKAMRLRPWIGQADICSSVMAPALPYYCPSMGICNIYTSTIHGGRISQRVGKAIQIFLLCITANPVLASPTPTTTSCSSNQFDETSTVRYIHDGDTLHLTDGRKIRLIGINTPELARDSRPAEPFAIESKNALKSLFKKNKSISLVFGKDKKDHYGRYLAHAFLANGRNAQAEILQRGLASAIAIPPNTLFAACYLESERSARCNKKGIWKDSLALEAKDLQKKHIGFHLIKGTVNNIKTDSKGIWLTLDNKLTIGIRPKNQSLFDLKAINNMLNQTIIVRGWLNKSNRSTPFYLRVRHPLSIQRLSSFSCK